MSQVAFEVGYESSSQFSREYTRMFGRSPIKDKQMASER
ncbi:AraC family transcriptional regulator [Noviherbaspirillum sp. Root189]|nr:AraC family transcriptional regulator [Noviherbaspirillum sp. Root189]